MNNEDKDKLAFLVKQYGLKDVVKCLADIADNETHKYNDLLLRDASTKWSVNTIILDKTAVIVED